MPGIFKSSGFRLEKDQIIAVSDQRNQKTLIVRGTQTGIEILNAKLASDHIETPVLHAIENRYLKIRTCHGIPDTIFPIEEEREK
ncbi:MAG: hypothetical protein HQK53_17255 [Oligoflexia bacterium]|nr:hypothetical protein [Oligoflexia bacterium]